MRIFLLFFPVLLLSCATATTLKLHEADKEELPHTAIVMNYDFKLQDEVMDGGTCQLTMRNLDHGGQYALPLEVGKGVRQVIAHAVPGRYEFTQVYCYSGLAFRFERDAGKIRVVSARTGKINHGGAIGLVQKEHRGKLMYYWESLDSKKLKSWSEKFVPAKDRARVESGFDQL